jgi:CHAD domain-containing protein
MSGLGRSATVADVVGAALDASVDRLLSHEAKLSDDSDPEHVHQARVATRRLRSDLRTFRDFVDEAWATDLRAELRWLGGELGEVRDIEVLSDRLRADVARLPTTEQPAGERLVRRLSTEWRASRERLSEALETPRYKTLRDHLVAGAQHPRCTPSANVCAVDALPAVVRRPWKKLRRTVDALGTDPSDDALHATRIRAKRVRYAAEATVPVFGKRARRFAAALARVQEVLGDHHDAVVARAWVAEAVRESAATDAYAAGMIAEMETGAADAARDAFTDAWSKAGRPKLRTWL